MLRIRIRDPVPFWPLDPGSGRGFFRIPDPGSRIPNPYFWDFLSGVRDKHPGSTTLEILVFVCLGVGFFNELKQLRVVFPSHSSPSWPRDRGHDRCRSCAGFSSAGGPRLPRRSSWFSPVGSSQNDPAWLPPPPFTPAFFCRQNKLIYHVTITVKSLYLWRERTQKWKMKPMGNLRSVRLHSARAQHGLKPSEWKQKRGGGEGGCSRRFGSCEISWLNRWPQGPHDSRQEDGHMMCLLW